ncbi:diguanylate cyclase, partial [Vibrio parahaemolyticus]
FVVLEGSGESAPVPNQNERSKLDALGYALSAKFLYVLEPIIHEGHVIGSIRVTLSHIPIINAQHSFLKDAGVLLLILAAGGIIFYITIDRIILRPLLDLNGAIQDVTFGNASHVQIRHHSKDEL